MWREAQPIVLGMTHMNTIEGFLEDLKSSDEAMFEQLLQRAVATD